MSTSNAVAKPLLLILLILQHHVFRAVSQQIFIDKVPAYSSLTACAQYPVSAIIRAQMSGCGDNGALTSYSCFCYASSSAFAAIISTAVVENCTQPTPTPQLEASSAVNVFSSYCQLGAQLGYPNPTATSSNSKSTSKSLSPAKTSTAAASSGVSNTKSQSGGLSSGAGVGIGIIIGLACAGVAFALFVLRRRSTRRRQGLLLADNPTSEMGATPRPSLPSKWASNVTVTAELPFRKEAALPELPVKDDASRGVELP